MSARLTRLLAVGTTAFAVAAPAAAHAAGPQTVNSFTRDGAQTASSAPAHPKAAAKHTRARSASSPCGWADTSLSGATLNEARQATLCLLNKIRRAHRLPPLSSSVRLRTAAWRHSRDMVRHKYFDHGAYIERIMRTGYLAGARSWRVGENIAWGGGRLATPGAIVNMWMHSARPPGEHPHAVVPRDGHGHRPRDADASRAPPTPRISARAGSAGRAGCTGRGNRRRAGSGLRTPRAACAPAQSRMRLPEARP